MALYKPLAGETFYDIAVKLYRDTALGIDDLLNLNPEIDLDLPDYYGQTFIYTAALSRKKPIFLFPERVQLYTWITRERQSIYDLAVQLYGDISKITELVKIFPNLDTFIPAGTVLTLDTPVDPIALFFKDRNLIVATDVLEGPTEGIFDETFDYTFE